MVNKQAVCSTVFCRKICQIGVIRVLCEGSNRNCMSENSFEYLLPVEPNMFAGRVDLANDMLADLVSAKGKSYALVGGRRCGKSRFMHFLAHGLMVDQVSPSGHWVGLPLYFDFKQESFKSADTFLAHHFGGDPVPLRCRCVGSTRRCLTCPGEAGCTPVSRIG